jgi:bifunctional pyridoxal-dependent enzyme with beta-cystathionase and maltose regulon repressor activities
MRLDGVPRFSLQVGRAVLEAAIQELGVGGSPTELFLQRQAAWLADNLARVRKHMEPLGIRVLNADDLWGIFCLLDLRSLPVDPEQWVLELESAQGVRLNTPAWSRTPGFARLCLSIPTPRLETALERIEAFVRQSR